MSKDETQAAEVVTENAEAAETPTETTAQPETASDAFQLPEGLEWLAEPETALEGYKNLKAKLDEEREKRRTLQKQLQDISMDDNTQQPQQQAETPQASLAELEEVRADRDRVQKASAIRETILTEAHKLGFNDLQDAVKFVDVASIQFDDNGTPQGIDEALKTLAESKPYLLRQPGRAVNTGTNNPAGGKTEPDMSWLPWVQGGKTPF